MLTRLLSYLMGGQGDEVFAYGHLPQRLRARHSALLRYSRHA